MPDQRFTRGQQRRRVGRPLPLLPLSVVAWVLAAPGQAAPLDVTVVSGEGEDPVDRAPVSVFVQAGDDWRQVDSRPTDRDGRVSFELPFEAGEVYQLRARSRFDQRVKRSGPLAAPGAYTFTVGGAQVSLSVWNVALAAPVPGARVTARRERADGSFEDYQWVTTDAAGMARFDLPGVDAGEVYVFATSPWFPGLYSEVVSEAVSGSGAMLLPVARNTISVSRANTGLPLADVLVRVYELTDAPDPVAIPALDARTDGEGRIFHDLAGLAEGRRYRFRAFDPLGDGTHHFSEPVTQARPVDLAVAPRPPAPPLDARAAQAVNRLTYGANAALLAHVEAVGVDVFIEEQLAPESIDDSEFDALVEGWGPGPDALYRDLHYFMLFHAILSKRQLREVMTAFWNNHFNTDNNKVSSFSTLNWEEHIVFREVAMTDFRQILGASAHSPAMIRYLDTQFSRPSAPNENYARELLELHTMGLDGGWTEQDVREIARVFTGWRTTGFDPRLHDDGDKIVLGHAIPGGGEEEGEKVLDILAAHPSTARHVCRKLTARFINDAPADSVVQGCAATWLRNAGDVRSVLRFLFTHPAFAAPSNFRGKVKTPLEYVAGVVRALELPLPLRVGEPVDAPVEFLMRDGLAGMGMELFRYPVPTGFPESGTAWVSSAQSLARVQFMAGLVFAREFDARDWLLARGLTSPADMTEHLAALFLNGRLDAQEKALLFGVLEDEAGMPLDIYDPRSATALADLIATIASLPRVSLQ